MTISPVSVGAAVTPTVIKTYISHYTKRSERHQKPTAHISYDEGLHLIRSFLEYASHHTVEDLQAFTSQWVPTPTWVRTESVQIPKEHITKAAERIVSQLGPGGVEEVGGVQWWQWRRKDGDLKADWIEMRADYNARKQLDVKCKRIMLYVHGGAYFFGSVDEHRYQLQRHARKLKARVFAPRYRLAPQFPFPCGLHDCLAAYLYLLSIHDKTEIILAGDSAGGGMVVSMLCLLRDQDLPLPAGAVLISPWVDLTHSFPSVAADNNFDYIPAHGFMHKPSTSWPPPNDDEMDTIRAGQGQNLVKGRNQLEKTEVETEVARDHSVQDDADLSSGAASGATEGLQPQSVGQPRAASTIPGPKRHLQIKVDGQLVEIKDQIQMYTTNQLLSHPLVSPVLQPSLGGLPPLLIMTGGGEVLRDEQIYLAHKAAHPERYQLNDEYKARYDPDGTILRKYKPTPVQLQVWEDLCHVCPTLSFTRPAKFMYRSVAQFGAWVLARAQKTDIEIVDDDDISIISTDSEASRHERQAKAYAESTGAVGKAGDPLPPFKHHMIRQRVDRHGTIYHLKDASELPALQMPPLDVGAIKVGPVRKWMHAKAEWDTRYARIKRKVQKRRIADFAKGDAHSFTGEEPPPSALAGRRKDGDMMPTKQKKSYWMAIWSGWGSKHDEETIKREENAGDDIVEEKITTPNRNVLDGDAIKRKSSRLKAKSMSKSRSFSGSARKSTIVSDAGQVEGDKGDHSGPVIAATDYETAEKSIQQNGADDTHLTPIFMPKFKTAPHLRNELLGTSDASSIKTGHSVDSPDDASTRAVFSAAGVARENAPAVGGGLLGAALVNAASHNSGSLTNDTASEKESLFKTDDQRSVFGGHDTPYSRRSVERLMSHQVDMDGVSIAGADDSAGPHTLGSAPLATHLRSPSSTAVVQHECIVDVVEGGVADPKVKDEEDVTPTQEKDKAELTPKIRAVPVVENGEVKLERPRMYTRGDTEFRTAMEQL